MKRVLNGKIYDTEQVEETLILGSNKQYLINRTHKGNFFLSTCEYPTKALSSAEARRLVETVLPDIPAETYAKFFNIEVSDA